MKPKLLDLFCCEGGAAKGYVDAGFEVVGVDIEPQPNYPYAFIQADAVQALRELVETGHWHGYALTDFAAIHASPPCQGYSNTQKLQGNEHPLLIEPVRALLEQSGKPYAIENVPGAPLLNPITLCGTMFGLETTRHRLFECQPTLWFPPAPCSHVKKTTKMGRKPKPGLEYMHIVGNFNGVAYAREVMDMPWASRYGLAQAIPPAYTKFIGAHLLRAAQ
ncbi:DNA cytosine methyltransferase [Hymenobacter latericus]|uniref:DNA cytosine methyltransferase n=1 Tax=Hymenobacter sp. YIM 151858-1 TaxID=2987688 RepID=UPI002226CE6D|nr:DNA cytosine methyltransferase [Hymenobacter sp. YIM 151858-1]UYZ60109.1 DNA cytosine methyltransferase [Hymenobacter sp. YIM 151858-1]